MTTQTTATTTERIEAVHERLQRARELFEGGNVQPVIGMTDLYAVRSSEGNGTYLVNGNCTCSDYEYRQHLNGKLCKHRLAVLLYLEQKPEGMNEGESEDLGW